MQHLISWYKRWCELKNHIPTSARYTLADKIERLFLETLELIFRAQYLKREEKIPLLQSALSKWDTLKFFLQVAWETKSLSTKHYELLSIETHAIGKMLWTWKESLKSKTPARAGDHQQ